MNRSNLDIVRNPVLALPAARALLDLPPESRAAIRALFAELSADGRVRAQKCLDTHKWPMALYWKCVAVYTGHIARAMGRKS